jgi:hypothetical protein
LTLLGSYLSDIFDKLNRLNTSLQSPNSTISQIFDEVSGLIKKMILSKSLCEGDSIEMFVNMSEYLQKK